eukprot:11761149-Karenia_brevis.AAC.1
MQLPRAYGTSDRPTPRNQVLSIVCASMAHTAWDKPPGSLQKAASDAVLGCPKHPGEPSESRF